MRNILVLVRHGKSEWSKLNRFTGWSDTDLSEKGVRQARRAGELLKSEGLRFDVAYTSALKRAQRTLHLILNELGQTGLPTHTDKALNERDFGDLTGLDKNEARKRWGGENVRIWSDSYDVPPPGGESLKDAVARVLPYYEARILPDVMAGKTVIVTGHETSLCSLATQLDRLGHKDVRKLHFKSGVPVVYWLNADGSVAAKRVLE